MKYDDGEFLLTAEELATVAIAAEVAHGTLSLVPPVLPEDAPMAAARAALAALDPATRRHLEAALGVLARPERVAMLHTTLADETVSRQLVAWPAGADAGAEVVFLARAAGTYRLGRRPATALRDLALQVLAARDHLDAAAVGLELSGAAVVTLLAALEHLCRNRLFSQLRHQAPEALVTPAAVGTVRGSAATEDFRSPLLFFEKLLPTSLDVEPPLDDVRLALDELVAAGLLEPAVGDAPAVYVLTSAADALADTVFHEGSKLGVRLSAVRPDGVVGHDALLFVRGPSHLLLFEVDGPSGAVATLDRDQAARLLEHLFVRPSAAPGPAPAAPTSRHFCHMCGTDLHGGEAFCSRCGTPVPGT